MFIPLLEGVRDHLRESLEPLGVPRREIEVREDRRAPSDAGQVSVSVYLADMIPADDSGGLILATDFGVVAAITTRAPVVPADRRGVALYTDIDEPRNIAIGEIATRVILSLHGSYIPIVKANANAPVGLKYGSPLELARSIGAPEQVGKEHFHLEDNQDTEEDIDYAALLLELYFVGGRQYTSFYSCGSPLALS